MKRFGGGRLIQNIQKRASRCGSGTNMSDTASDEKFGLGGPCSCSACDAKSAHTTMLCDCTSEKDERTLPNGDRYLSCSQIFESGFETHQSWEEYCSMRNTDEGKKFGAEVEANIAREGPRTFNTSLCPSVAWWAARFRESFLIMNETECAGHVEGETSLQNASRSCHSHSQREQHIFRGRALLCAPSRETHDH